MPSQGILYTDVDRQRVIAEYVVLGNASKVARAVDIPIRTVCDWVSSEWGLELIAKVRHENQDAMISGYSNIISKALMAVDERLDTGDYLSMDDSGNMLYKPVSAKDAMVIAGISNDKMRLLSNQPTSITSTDGALTRIAEQLASYAKDRDERVIDTQTDTQVE